MTALGESEKPTQLVVRSVNRSVSQLLGARAKKAYQPGKATKKERPVHLAF